MAKFKYIILLILTSIVINCSNAQKAELNLANNITIDVEENNEDNHTIKSKKSSKITSTIATTAGVTYAIASFGVKTTIAAVSLLTKTVILIVI